MSSLVMSSLAEEVAAATPNYDSFLGAVLVGLLVEVLLYGVACMQTFFYFRHSRSDRLMFKLIVAAMTLFNTIQLAALSNMIYYWLVTCFGNIAATHQPRNQAVVEVTFSAFNDLIVRGFFARRVFILCSKKRRAFGVGLAVLVVTMSIAVFIMTSTYSIKIFFINHIPATPAERTKKQQVIGWLLYTFYTLGACADLIIAISLSILLAKNRTGFKRTDDLVSFWMLFSMNSGIITSIFAIAALLLYAVRPSTLYSLAVSYILAQLHVNSLLVSLNARGALRSHGTNDPSTTGTGNEGHLSMNTGGGQGTNSFAIPLRETKMAITKEVTTYSDSGKPMDL